MTLPPPGTPLLRAPVVHVLAQVRFSPIPQIEERVEAIRSRLKVAGFPIFRKGEISSLVLSNVAEPKLDKVLRWDFLDLKRETGVVLASDFVLLQTTRYGTYRQFAGKFRSALEAVAEVTDGEAVERIGLRYIDLIRVGVDETFADYLAPGLLGFPVADASRLEAVSALSRTETIAETARGTLVIRCFQRNDGHFLPPDLRESELSYPISLAPNEPVAVLDVDHYVTKPRLFETDGLMTTIDALHSAVRVAFEHAVTPYALNRWQQEPDA